MSWGKGNLSEKFIAVVIEFPYLYDKSNVNFKDIKKKERAWQQIGEKFNNTGDEAKNYFKSLRGKFLRIKKNKEQATRSGAGALKEKDWEIYNLMSFLEEVIRPRKTTGSFGEPGEASLSGNNSQCSQGLIENIADNSIKPVNLTGTVNKAEPQFEIPSSPECLQTQYTTVSEMIMEQSQNLQLSDVDVPQTDEPSVDTFRVRRVAPEGVELLKRKLETPRGTKRKKEEEIASVSNTLESISRSLREPPRESTATEAFCQYLLCEMRKLPDDIEEDLKDNILEVLLAKKKVAKANALEE